MAQPSPPMPLASEAIDRKLAYMYFDTVKGLQEDSLSGERD